MSRQELCRAIAAGLVFSALSYAGAAAEDVQINETMNNLYIADHHTHQYVGNNVIIAPRDHTQTAVKLDYESLVELKADSQIRINGHTGIKADHTDIALQAGANTDITAVSTDRDSAYGIYNTVGLVSVKGGSNTITASGSGRSRGIGISSGGIGNMENWTAGISLQAEEENRITADTIGIEFGMGSTITLSGNHNIVQAGQSGIYSWWGGWRGDKAILAVNGPDSAVIAENDGSDDVFGVQFERAYLILNGTTPNLSLSAASKQGNATGVFLLDSTLTSNLETVTILAETQSSAKAVGIRADQVNRNKAIEVSANDMVIVSRTENQGTALGIEAGAGTADIQADNLCIGTVSSGDNSLSVGLEAATGNIAVQADSLQIHSAAGAADNAVGIRAAGDGTAARTVSVQAGTIAVQAAGGNGIAVQAAAGSSVKLNARGKTGHGIILDGAVVGRSGAVISMDSDGGAVISSGAERQTADTAYSSTISADEKSAVFITARRGKNIIQNVGTAAGQRVVWAADGSTVAVRGATSIQAGNGQAIAVAAGDGLASDGAGRSRVDIAYGDGSAVLGRIVAGAGGDVSLASVSGTERIQIDGDALAENGGTVDLRLGKYSIWNGRADGYSTFPEHTALFAPPLGEVQSSGTVTLVLGEGAEWNVRQQSWLSALKGSGIVHMDGISPAHALHIGHIEGSHTFIMNGNRSDHGASDMLYIQNGTAAGTQIVQFSRIAGIEQMNDGETLRFATVNAGPNDLVFTGAAYDDGHGSTLSRYIQMRDAGVMDRSFVIGHEAFAADDDENTGYNGEQFTAEKPGEAYVEDAYADGTNWFIQRIKQADIVSDAGRTVIAMSRANYENAIYMDRLNKRMGEARYIDGDEGLWVRIRHDRIGKSDAFRSMNTMMELGYDTRVNDRDDGEHRQGAAIDYMRGTADYKNVAGEGDVRRGGIWLYDTWLGNKGHYTDYVLKFGRLSNDFELYTRTLGEKVTGGYSNFVCSASAEYGRRKDLGNNWYIEPQAQIQYAHVTDADYTTSQDTQVQVGAIDSLIGRVGFRLGKDVGEKSTFYIKADVLHEFLGDQDIEARDATGLLRTTYENEGTWCDIGLGFSHQFSKDTYMYLDMEKSIGNDNEDTYQFNFGMNWKV